MSLKNNALSMPQRRETARELHLPSLSILLLAILLTLLLTALIGFLGLSYSTVVVGILIIAIILLLRLNELAASLLIAVHVIIDSYLGFDVYQVALLVALVLFVVCYFGRSTKHPWTGPRAISLWILFLVLTIYPTIDGGAFGLRNAIAFYLNLVFSAFIMFWLGNIVAKDVSSVQRVFQFLSVLAAFIAIHTIIEASTGKFLFASARANTNLVQLARYQLVGAALSRAGSFLGNPNGNGVYLATSFFLPLGLFITSKRLWAKMLYLLEALLILLALMFTYSTGSWIALLGGVLIFLFFVGRLRYSLLLLMLIAVLTVAVLTVFPLHFAAQLSHVSQQGELSLHIGDWQTSMRVIQAFPLFGVGLGNQAYLIRAEPYRVPAQTVPLAEPDNSFLQWGAIAGIPVMLVFLALLGVIFFFAWRNWQTVNPRYRPLLGGGIVALIALSINSLSVDGWTNPSGIEYLGWLIAGVISSPFIATKLQKSVEQSLEEPR